MRKSILTLGIAAVLTGVLATCSMAYAADDKLAQIQESGKLKVGVEQGKHKELLEKKGYYYQLVRQQFANEESRKVLS